MTAYVTALCVSWLCFFLYACIVNAYSIQAMNMWIFPTPIWLILMFWLVPALSFFALAVIVCVSEKASSVWEAQQVSSLLVLPLLGLMISQTTGLMFMDEWAIFLAGLTAVFADIISVDWIAKNMSREKLITRM